MDLWKKFIASNILIKVIAVNAVVFIVLNIILVFMAMSNPELSLKHLDFYLESTSNIKSLLFRPWTLITYMFTHRDFSHIFFNMLFLFVFGKLFLSFFGEKKFLSTYIMGGLSGLLFYIISYNLIPALDAQNSYILGASASVMGIVVASAAYQPNYKLNLMIFGPVKLWLIALILIVIDLSSLKYFDNTGGHLAHIGGALFGYFFAVQYKKGMDLNRSIDAIIAWIQNLFAAKSNLRVVKKSKKQRPISDDEYNAQKVDNQKKVDRILDKISKSGYDSLSKDEKDFLFRQGEN